MAKLHDHSAKYGTNTAGKSFFRNVDNPESALHGRLGDTASLQYAECGVGMTDIDACSNYGFARNRVSILLEYKLDAAKRRFPAGQKITLANWADDVQTAVAMRNGMENDWDRVPGTASVVLKVTHPDVPVFDAAECIVDEVYFAHIGLKMQKENPRWGQANAWKEQQDKMTVAQFFYELGKTLSAETKKTSYLRPADKLMDQGRTALREIGREDLITD